MSLSPYRTAAERDSRPTGEPAERSHDAELLLIYALLWLVLVTGVMVGVARGEEFGASLSLELAGVVALPWLAKDGLRALFRRLWRSAPRRDA